MATRYINTTLGAKVGEVQQATSSHAGAAAGDLTLSYDDTKINTLAKLRAALDAKYLAARGNNFFTP